MVNVRNRSQTVAIDVLLPLSLSLFFIQSISVSASNAKLIKNVPIVPLRLFVTALQ